MTTDLSRYNANELPSADVLSRQRYAIVVADWNSEITHALAQGAIDTLVKHGVKEENIDVMHVPGTVELTYGAAQYVSGRKQGKGLLSTPVNAVIVIGCVIKGDTPHFDYVCLDKEVVVLFFSADNELGVVDKERNVGVSLCAAAFSVPVGHHEEGEVGAVVTENVFGNGASILVGVNDRANVVLIKVSYLLVGSQCIIVGYVVELEVVFEVIDSNVAYKLIFHSVIGSVFVGLGHFHVSVGYLDVAIVGNVFPNYLCVGRTVRGDNVLNAFSAVSVSVSISILEPCVSACAVVLRLITPVRSRHTSEVGKRAGGLVKS